MRASKAVVVALLAFGLAACADGSSLTAQPGAEAVRYELPGTDVYTLEIPSGEKCVLYSGSLECDFPLRTEADSLYN